jgi:hypothetical protein
VNTLTRRVAEAAAIGVLVMGAATYAMPAPDPADAGSGLRAVHAPRAVIGDIDPPPGACTYRAAADGQTLPDALCTPGAVDPAVTPDNIAATICRPGYTDQVRPSSSVTARWERRSAVSYAAPHGTTGEYDHLVPLQLGGANSTSNLWPEPGDIPNPKDTVEGRLKRAVCAGLLPLHEAQRRIATDWTTALRGLR